MSTPLTSASHSPAVSRVSFVLVIVLVAWMAALTGPRVFTAALWGDELRTWRDGIDKPLADVVSWRHNPDHAPLGHLLARAGAAAVGFDQITDRPWSVRLLPWLCALACVPAIWRLGRTLDGDAAGLLIALLLVSDPTFLFQSTQSRMYSPLLLAVIVALTAAARLLSRPPADPDQVPRRRHAFEAMTLSLAIALGLWSHSQTYAIVVPILITALVVLLIRDQRRAAMLMLAATLIGLLLASPSLMKLVSKRAKDPLDDEAAARPFAQLEDATQALTGENWLSGVLVACAIAGFVVIGRSRGRALAWMLAGVVIAGLANLLIAARYRPVGFSRYLLVIEPSLWAGVAALAVELCRFAGRSGRVAARRATVAAVSVAMVALCVHGLIRAWELLPAHPLAGPYRDALGTAMAEVRDARRSGVQARLVTLPRAPFISYGRIYGLNVGDVHFDQDLFDAVSTKAPRGRDRRPPPTTQQVELLGRNDPVTIVAVVPARERNRRSGDDPITFAGILANARGLKLPEIPTPDGTLRVVIIRFDGAGGVVVEDPKRPALTPP